MLLPGAGTWCLCLVLVPGPGARSCLVLPGADWCCCLAKCAMGAADFVYEF